jgi:trafficking protein particle complex subunit 5
MKRSGTYDKNIKSKKEVSANAFYFLFSEIVQYCVKKDPNDLERQLEEIGYPLGARFLELVCLREKSSRKETSIKNILLFIGYSVWPIVFNKTIVAVEQHQNINNIFMIKEEASICNQYACLPRNQRHVNCSAFIAGVVEGILNAAEFPARVIAIFNSEETKEEDPTEKTTYLIHFDPEVVNRDLSNKN